MVSSPNNTQTALIYPRKRWFLPNKPRTTVETAFSKENAWFEFMRQSTTKCQCTASAEAQFTMKNTFDYTLQSITMHFSLFFRFGATFCSFWSAIFFFFFSTQVGNFKLTLKMRYALHALVFRKWRHCSTKKIDSSQYVSEERSILLQPLPLKILMQNQNIGLCTFYFRKIKCTLLSMLTANGSSSWTMKSQSTPTIHLNPCRKLHSKHISCCSSLKDFWCPDGPLNHSYKNWKGALCITTKTGNWLCQR